MLSREARSGAVINIGNFIFKKPSQPLTSLQSVAAPGVCAQHAHDKVGGGGGGTRGQFFLKQPFLKEGRGGEKITRHTTVELGFNVSPQTVKNTKVQTRNNHNVVANIINMEL